MTVSSSFKSHGIREPLTNRIAGILDEYPDGTQIARELLQNSDDARSKLQWYLLDHHSYISEENNNGDNLSLFHPDLKEYMGPALLAGNDSKFEDKDFKSMKNLAASEKRHDETKIGQMGIGFNRIFNGVNSAFTEGAVRGNFVDNNEGLLNFPDQLKPFAVQEDLNFSESYDGTIFRFPLRTDEQAKESKLSKKPYSPEKVLKMLMKLKDEALKAMLFLKHIERIIIYERKSIDERPRMLFEIKIENSRQVQSKRQELLKNLKSHVYPKSTDSRNSILEYSIQPEFKMIQADKSETVEQWHISTLIGNVLKSREYMSNETDGNLDAHKLIPWVGIAAPLSPDVKISNTGNSGLFCFLPISIQLPFPVHINGHFAVKQSRREIWTNQDNDFGSDASAYIKSAWNVHLFKTHVPEVYAKFLKQVGTSYGSNYDLWPVSCGTGVGLEVIWKNLLVNVLENILQEELDVFFCTSTHRGLFVSNYKSLWIADRDVDQFPLLVETLQGFSNIATGIPDTVLQKIPGVAADFGLENRFLTPAIVRKLLRDHKGQWSSHATPEARVEMLKYCLRDFRDGIIQDLEGLPLLPLTNDNWVEFKAANKNKRYFVNHNVFKVLEHSKDGLVDLEVDSFIIRKFEMPEFMSYWTTISNTEISRRIHDMYNRLFYNYKPAPKKILCQPINGLPSIQWVQDFWSMVKWLGKDGNGDGDDLLKGLEGLHLLPLTRNSIAPLSKESQVIYVDSRKDSNRSTLMPLFRIMDSDFDCRMMREKSGDWKGIASRYISEIGSATNVLSVLSEVDQEKLLNLDQNGCKIICEYIVQWLPLEDVLENKHINTLRSLPIYRNYSNSKFVSIYNPGSSRSEWRIASGFSHSTNRWEPRDLKLLSDGQAMTNHIRDLNLVESIRESDYWHDIFRQLEMYIKTDWDDMMNIFCGKYHVHCKDYNFASLLIDKPFVRARGPNASIDSNYGPRLTPRDIVDPNLSSHFSSEEIVFPAGVYAQPIILSALRQIGILSEFDANFIRNRVLRFSSIGGKEVKDDDKQVLSNFYAALDASFSSDHTRKVQDLLHNSSWILAKNIRYGGHRCYSPNECRPDRDVKLVRTQMPIATFSFQNDHLISCIGWNKPPPLNKVLPHFLSIIDPKKREGGSANTTFDEALFPRMYKYMKDEMSKPGALEMMKRTLKDRAWIFINGQLYTADRVTLQSSTDLTPFIMQYKSRHFDPFFLAMGVRKDVTQSDLQDILKTIANKYSGRKDDKLSASDSGLANKLLIGIAEAGEYTWNPKLLVLTDEKRLVEIKYVLFDDINARQDAVLRDIILEKNSGYKFLNDDITRTVAEKLAIRMLSAQYWNDTQDSTFEGWAQEEDIMDRIRNILNDYLPTSVVVEFLQNAADAKATKCCFMLDQRSFQSKSLLSEEMKVWQGPALVIYNDAEFSTEDFQALCKLGAGSKRGDPSKIGRHGLGFNSVYHFTDVPSVVSGSFIGFFDPKKAFLPKIMVKGRKVAQGGQRCDFTKLAGDTYADQLEPYKGLFGCDMKSPFKGTIFRIPLRSIDTRTEDMKGQQIGKEWSCDNMLAMLKSWVEDANVATLFLETINTIELGVISHTPSESDFRWTVKKYFGVVDSTLQKRFDEINGKASKDPEVVGDSKIVIPRYLLEANKDKSCFSARGVEIRSGKPYSGTKTTKWIVLTNNKFQGKPEDRKDVMDLSIKNSWHPHTGIVWYLWSVHSGAFKSHEIGDAIEKYFSFWPTVSNESNQQFTTALIQQLHKYTLFPVHNGRSDVRFFNGHDVRFLELIDAPSQVIPIMQRYLSTSNDAICCCPAKQQSLLFKTWESNGLEYKIVDEDYVRHIVRNDSKFIPMNFKTPELKRWILEYTLGVLLKSSDNTMELLKGLCLLPLMDGTWKPLYSPSICYYTKANNSDLDLAPLIDNKMILLDSSLFVSTTHFLTSTPEKSSKLEKILNVLISKNVGVIELIDEVFTQIYNTENPNGESSEKQSRLFVALKMRTKLASFKGLLIFKDWKGKIRPLEQCVSAIEISTVPPWLMSHSGSILGLLETIGIIIYDRSKNLEHPYLTDNAFKISIESLAKLLSFCAVRLPQGREITVVEAQCIRDIILKAIPDLTPSVCSNLGLLKIWLTDVASSDGRQSTLISAHGSSFISGDYSLQDLGRYPDLISSDFNATNLMKIGATPLDAVKALLYRVLPQFLDGTLICTGSTKSAYIALFVKYCAVVCHKDYQGFRPTNLSVPLILANDGSFKRCDELLNPEGILGSIYSGRQDLFPDTKLWADATAYQRHKKIFALRDISSPNVVTDCANYLSEIINITPSEERHAVKPKAESLVRHIYQSCINKSYRWMDQKWTFVPTHPTSGFPYNESTPNHSSFMSFGTLINPKYRDICWTQCSFFPDDLVPPATFVKHYPSIGIPSVGVVCRHLHTLVSELAPNWKTRERQRGLKDILFEVYKWFEEFAAKDPRNADALGTELKKIYIPYILNGKDKDTSQESSWSRPGTLLLDTEDVDCENAVEDSLREYSTFLKAAGVQTLKSIKFQVKVPTPRKKGLIEEFIVDQFKSQDQNSGFMDISFTFPCGRTIKAHKLILTFTNEHFVRRLRGIWAENISYDPNLPGMDIIEINTQEDYDTYDVMWGLFYFLYSGRLIHTNGPTQESQSATKGFNLADRIQYLMCLLQAADVYESSELKVYIAYEITSEDMVIRSNVMNIYKYAKEFRSPELHESCLEYLRLNYDEVADYYSKDLKLKEKDLEEAEDMTIQYKLREEIDELMDELNEFKGLSLRR
ncbi:hypothetical protein BGZ76_003753 [Entomortierella beljakovae]|nr:hypothetical protein BGZ76_003753 [Entomortierella beljakovae]